MAKRGQNEGTISKRKDGRWMARLNLGYANGKRKRLYIYGTTRKDVAEKLVAAQRELQQGLPVAVERQTVAQFLEHWMSEVAKHKLATSTFESYDSKIRLHVLPQLGRLTLAKLTPQHLTRLYSMLLDEGLSPGTARYVHAILHKALEQAVRWNLIARNPADAVDPPRPGRGEIRPLEPEQVKRLLAAAKEDRLCALYLIALTSTMRQGELLGLKWADVAWEAAELHVRWKVLSTRTQGLSFSAPKTRKGQRTITTPGVVMDSLRRHRTAQLEERPVAGSRWVDHDLVFPNGVGKPIERQNLNRRSYKPLLEQAGLPDFRFHDLRHSAATVLLLLGVYPKVVQERLGHATIGVTMDIYSHVMPSMQREAADKLEAFLMGSA